MVDMAAPPEIWLVIWTIPRLYHLLTLRASRDGGQNGDKATYTMPVQHGFFSPWLGLPRLATYDADRDQGPGQIIDLLAAPPGPLPGGDPTVTRNDQLLDALTRGGQQSALVNHRRAAVARQIVAAPPYRIIEPGQAPPAQLIDRETASVLDAEWKEEENG